MTYLGLDLGTRTGWALLDGDGLRLGSGAWDCAPRRDEGEAHRWRRFSAMFLAQLVQHRPDVVAVEDVRRHLGTRAAHVYGGLRALTELMCLDCRIRFASVPVQAAKRTATGRNVADKVTMIEAARARWPELPGGIRDDEADALWIAETARLELEAP